MHGSVKSRSEVATLREFCGVSRRKALVPECMSCVVRCLESRFGDEVCGELRAKCAPWSYRIISEKDEDGNEKEEEEEEGVGEEEEETFALHQLRMNVNS